MLVLLKHYWNIKCSYITWICMNYILKWYFWTIGLNKINFTCFFLLLKIWLLEHFKLYVACILFPLNSLDMGGRKSQWKYLTFNTLAFVSGWKNYVWKGRGQPDSESYSVMKRLTQICYFKLLGNSNLHYIFKRSIDRESYTNVSYKNDFGEKNDYLLHVPFFSRRWAIVFKKQRHLY